MRPTVPAVGLDSRRDRASDQACRSLEGEEDDVRPAGGEKGTRRHLWSRLGPLLIWRPDTEGSMMSPAKIIHSGPAHRALGRRRRREPGECGAVVHEPRRRCGDAVVVVTLPDGFARTMVKFVDSLRGSRFERAHDSSK